MLPVSIGTPYVLRLEATADKLRAYDEWAVPVGGDRLDFQHRSLRIGDVQYAADFDDVVERVSKVCDPHLAELSDEERRDHRKASADHASCLKRNP